MFHAGRYYRFSLAAIAMFLAILGFAQNKPDSAYQRHIKRLRQLLPANSALPPMLDLSRSRTRERGASRAWERKFTGSMLAKEIVDPGIAPPIGMGSVSLRTVEYAMPIYALPVQKCDVIVVAEPVTSAAHLAYTNRLVYSTFILKISQVLKGSKKPSIRVGDEIRAAQMGGTLRFPSGHVETFLWTGSGFMKVGQKYLLFMWQPIRGDDTYVVPEAYLMQGGLTFPIDTVGGGESAYAGVPFIKFESSVRAAIAKNIDTN